jgi:hypothetical protein
MTDILPEIDFIDDPDRGWNILPQFLKEDPNIKTILNSFMSEIQEAYDELKNYSDNANLSNAAGFILDQFGSRVDLLREPGQSDAAYRIAISSKIKATSSFGSAPQIIDLFSILTNANSVKYDQVGLRSISVSAVVDTIESLESEQIKKQMLSIIALGVGVDFSLKLENESFLFGVNSDAVPEGRGFGIVDDTDGGKMDLEL